MIEDIEQKGVKDRRVLDVMENIPRHEFVPEKVIARSYDDSALPIAEHQTISQPYIVAYMTSALVLKPNETVLEIGTGSGYQTAILAGLCKRVCTIELNENLALQARSLLKKMKIENVDFFVGDGFGGVSQKAPFDAIIVTAAPTFFPVRLADQLKEGGRMIIPIGPSVTDSPDNKDNEDTYQWLYLVKKIDGRLFQKKLIPVRFVPMVQSGFKK
ncbi:MAG: protein-L-isoaspartate(D-aspartate) O-methyltransferase [Cyanobacteria bacterium TGS_CYA1]|nr:protein-L-isoaspartate(D-aspartate) O-methyltransferase [Cyanobacteria bacterium TGS_CYA1]